MTASLSGAWQQEGSLCGLSKTALDAAIVLDALGKDIIFIETAGVGQSETAVKDIVHTVVVVITPGLGDDIQMMKAGIMEIADIFVVNKADLKNAEETAKSIEDMISLLPQKERDRALSLQLHQRERGLRGCWRR